MRVQSFSTKLAITALALGAGVFMRSGAVQAFPWDDDMYRGPQISTFAVAPRVMPNGTLPIDGIHYNAHWGQPQGMPEQQAQPPMKLEAMTVKAHNPLQANPDNLAKGKERFETNCAPCHGDHGLGNGPVAHLLEHAPKNLLTGVSKNLPDGYIYGYIRDGGIWMPSYVEAMSATERWQIVLYVRDLQTRYASEKPEGVSPPPLTKGEVSVNPRPITDSEKGFNEIGSDSP
jgi:mono/diheme cytochrome c family protein